jgi:hypothetical protein
MKIRAYSIKKADPEKHGSRFWNRHLGERRRIGLGMTKADRDEEFASHMLRLAANRDYRERQERPVGEAKGNQPEATQLSKLDRLY